MKFLLAIFLAGPLLAVSIPAGTEFNVRLTTKISSEARDQTAAVHAVLIAPVLVEGNLAISPGAQLTGTISQSKAATGKEPALIQLIFTDLSDGPSHS